MKTPKRKGISTPPDSAKDCEQRTRWKRKNNEAQLKRTIARLKEQAEFQTKRAEALREMYIEALNRNTFLEMKLALDIRHNKK